MTVKPPPASAWRIPLVREISVILLIKLALLLVIKSIWFSAPTVPLAGTEQMAKHLFAAPASPPPLPALEETPR